MLYSARGSCSSPPGSESISTNGSCRPRGRFHSLTSSPPPGAIPPSQFCLHRDPSGCGVGFPKQPTLLLNGRLLGYCVIAGACWSSRMVAGVARSLRPKQATPESVGRDHRGFGRPPNRLALELLPFPGWASPSERSDRHHVEEVHGRQGAAHRADQPRESADSSRRQCVRGRKRVESGHAAGSPQGKAGRALWHRRAVWPPSFCFTRHQFRFVSM
jgi:hypothetical protein